MLERMTCPFLLQCLQLCQSWMTGTWTRDMSNHMVGRWYLAAVPSDVWWLIRHSAVAFIRWWWSYQACWSSLTMVNLWLPAASILEQFKTKVLQAHCLCLTERLTITPVAQPGVTHREVETSQKSHMYHFSTSSGVWYSWMSKSLLSIPPMFALSLLEVDVMVLASTDTIWLVTPSVSCTGLRGTLCAGNVCSLWYRIISCKKPFSVARENSLNLHFRLIFDVLPQIPCSLSFIAYHDLIDGLLGSLRLLQEGFGDGGEEWAHFIKHCCARWSYHWSAQSAKGLNRLDDISSATCGTLVDRAPVVIQGWQTAYILHVE